MLRDESVGPNASWCGIEGEQEHDERCATLHRALKRIVKARGALDAREAEALREAEQLRLWRHYGYSSLLEYMEIEMGYSPRAALERLRVAKAIVELPVLAEAMTQGDLSFSAARELTRVATPETETQWLEAASDKNLRQLEDLVTGRKRGDKPSDPADSKLRKRKLRFDELDEETVALLRQARQILERELGDRLDDNAFARALGRMVLDGAASPERTRAPYQIAVLTCDQCKRAWQDGGGLTVEMSPPAFETAQCDAQHIGTVDRESDEHSAGAAALAVDRDGFGTATADRDDVGVAAPDRDDVSATTVQRDASSRSLPRPPKRSRTRSAIPPALRRKVNARDHGRCRVPWCRSSRNIDQHHLRPVSEGGTHTLENLITLCESHHLALHEGSLIVEGTASQPRFTRRAQTAFTAVQHAVETAGALRKLGFKKHEVAAALDRTKTHVGTAALTREQWIKVALSYCPKPS